MAQIQTECIVECILNLTLIYLKRFLLICILFLIVFAAHPFEPILNIQNKVWHLLYGLGIDVAMTPITSDMMLMWDEKNQTRAYTSHFSIKIEDEIGQEYQLSGPELDFYFLRIPILLMVDYQADGASIAGFLDLICKNLNKKLRIKTSKWQIENSQNSSILSDSKKCP